MTTKTQPRWWNSIRRGLKTVTQKRGRIRLSTSAVGRGIEPLERRELLAVLFVDDSAVGTGDGSSWQDAYVSLQSALGPAGSGTEIRVAQGTYKPTTDANRDISFQLKNGVAIYGGYAGYEPPPTPTPATWTFIHPFYPGTLASRATRATTPATSW